jgi:anti-sigma-K factor RskA
MVDEKQITSYLLGDLSEEEESRIEERFLRDVEYRESIQAVEDDLIDEYVRGELTPSGREQFEKRFMSLPHRRQRVEFAKALTKAFAEPHALAAVRDTSAVDARELIQSSLLNFLRTPKWAFRFAMAALAVLLVFSGLWLLNKTGQRRTQPDGLQAERQPSRQTESLPAPTADAGARHDEQAVQPQSGREPFAQGKELAGQKPPREQEGTNPLVTRRSPAPSVAIASFVLSPGMARSGNETQKLLIPQTAQLIRLRLDIERGDEYQSYRAELRTVSGNTVWKRDMLRAQSKAAGSSVVLSLPNHILTPGEYELTFTGITGKEKSEDVGYYYLSVLKR